MSRGLLLIGALALAACSKASSRGPYQLDLQPGDEAKIAEGALPILIVKDGRPSPKALFQSAPAIDLAGWVVPNSVIESGQRESVLDRDAPGVTRADGRGIVWWTPDEVNSIWWLRASQDARAASYPQVRGLLADARSAARSGYVLITLDLWRLRSWDVQLSGIGQVPVPAVPIFLGSEEDRRVLTSLEWQPDGTVRGLNPVQASWQESEGFFIWAGLDRDQAFLWPSGFPDRLAFNLESCGSMEIELFDADGAPVHEPRAVFIEVPDRDLNWSHAGSAPNSPSVPAQDGRAIMHGVPIGKRWRVGAYLLPEGTIVATEVAGPTQAGEVVRVRLSAAETSVLLLGRLLGPDGAPESAAAWTVRAGGANVRFQTQADGSFRVRIPRLILDGATPMMLWSSTAWAEPQRTCTLAPADILASTEETEWIWKEQPFFALGRVVDETGEGVPFIALSDMGYGMDADADASGRFRLKEAEDYAQAWLEISTFSPWHLSHETMIQRGQRDAILPVTTAARISGRLTGKAKIRSWKVIRPDQVEAELHYGGFDWIGPQGAFEIGPVPVDATELRIDCGKNGVAMLRDLRLEAGKVYKLPKPVHLDR